MEFNKSQIRAVKGAQASGSIFWIRAELLINGKWVYPYFVDEEKLRWYEPEKKMDLNHKNIKKEIQDWLSSRLRYINEILSDGYKIVGYGEFKEIVHKYFYGNIESINEVYLD